MESQPLGIIFFHKHPTSAKVSYLRSAEGGVVFGVDLPELATLIDEETVLEKEEVVATHPAMLISSVSKSIGLTSDDLDLRKDFRARLDVPGDIVSIYLVRFKDMDPPFEAVEQAGAKFIAITEARGLPPVQLQLLQKTYQYIMEG